MKEKTELNRELEKGRKNISIEIENNRVRYYIFSFFFFSFEEISFCGSFYQEIAMNKKKSIFRSMIPFTHQNWHLLPYWFLDFIFISQDNRRIMSKWKHLDAKCELFSNIEIIYCENGQLICTLRGVQNCTHVKFIRAKCSESTFMK